ncbi:sulfatase-like hydrolase/transferase [Acidobacteriota bacterium]
MKNNVLNRRNFLKKTGVGIAALALSSCERKPSKNTASSVQIPNFIIILTDDQGYGDLGCYGGEGFSTPNLDTMASEGIKFSDFYVAATVCTPSRAGLLTGCYPKRVGLHEAVLFPYSTTGLHSSELTIPELLKPQGYNSACIGKWHLGHQKKFLPLQHGFDEFFGVPYSNDMDNYYYKSLDFQSPPLPLYHNEEQIEAGPDQRFLTRRYTEQAQNFIKSNRNNPFFLYLPHSMPHLPLHVSDEFKGKSELGLYGDVLEELDWSVGQIQQTLKAQGLEDNTFVIFTSDNGPVVRPNAGSAGPLRGGKASTWEGGQRVPCIMKWPGQIPSGTICKEIVTAMDLFPTIADISGASLPKDRPIDGQDILGLLQKPESTPSPHDSFHYYARDGNIEAVRSGKWKLHIAKTRGWDNNLGKFPKSLYNLEEDIGETKNLVDQHPEIVSRLHKKLKEFDVELNHQARPIGIV